MSKKEQSAQIPAEPKPEVKVGGVQLPGFIEAAMTLTRILLVLLVPATMLIALFMHCAWYAIILRGLVAGVVVGFLGWLLNWMLGRFLIEASITELKALGVVVVETPKFEIKA
jgi:hypothetical protein